jgi:hypothetical protein
MKVFEKKFMSAQEIANMGICCAWKGCHQGFKGNAMPKGWTWLWMFWSKQPQPNINKIPPQDMLRDAALCPEHTMELDLKLKDIGRALAEPMMGEA